MNIRRVAKGVEQVVKSDNPGQTAGRIVRAGVTAAHPVAGVVLGHLIEKGTEAAVNKGIEVVKNPEVQAKVKQVASSTVDAGARAIRRGAGSIAARVSEFRAGHGK